MNGLSYLFQMILLLTHQQDFYTIDLVQESLSKKGAASVRVNMDDFPLSLQLTKVVDNTGTYISFSNNGKRIDTRELKGVWLRKYWTPRINPEIDPAYSQGCFRESKEVLDIFIHSLEKLPFIDPLPAIKKASNKLYQMEVARANGMRIPRTLITNDHEQLKEFYSNAHTEIVAKMLTTLTASMQASDFFFYTSKVTREHMEEVDLSDCPMTFQEYIEKDYELRIIYVDGNFFAGKIDASKSKRGQVDWRKAMPGEVTWEHYELPGNIKRQLTQFMNAVGLVYGAIDIIKNRNGEYVFLEVNPIGEWGMLQRDLDYKISDAIADALIKRIER